MTVEPALVDVIREAFESRLLDVHVALPGRVELFTPGSPPTVNVLPLIRRALLTEDETAVRHEDLPVLPDVPVVYPSASSFSMTWPLSKGDTVMLLFSSAAIGNWRTSGTLSNPNSLDRHALSDAVALPCVWPSGKSLPNKADAAVIELTAPVTALEVGFNAPDFAGAASKIENTIGQLAAAILNAPFLAGDGGATIQTAAKSTLSGLGWGFGTSPPVNSTASSNLKVKP